MSGIVYGVVTLDPITGKPAAMQADLDWNLGTAAIIADTLGGRVFAAPRGAWQPVPAEAVAAALEASKQAAIDTELRKMTEKNQ